MPSLLDWLLENEPLFRKTRLPSLYSDLTVQKNTNPEGYAANVQAWQSALTRATLAGQLPTEQLFILQASDELLTALSSPQYGRPSGLGAVIDECVRQGKMIDLKDFASADKSIYSKSWLPSPWAVLRWSLQQAGLISTGTYNLSGRLRHGSLVVVPALEELTKKITAWQSQQPQTFTDRIITREAFTSQLSTILNTPNPISPSDLSVLLTYLSRDRHLLSYNSTTIKFTSPSQPHPQPVTPEDISIAQLKQHISSLTTEVSLLESRISEQQTRASNYVKQKNKTSALAALRSKKRAEQALEQRTATLNQLEDVYSSIEQAADQIGIVETLQSSAEALKVLNKRVGDVDKVEDVVEQLREEMGKTEEVQGVLNEPLKEDVVGEEEVDEEFEKMEREAKEAEERRGLEEMRRKLEEGGSVPEGVQVKERGVDTEGKEAGRVVEELAKSVEKLDGLKISDRSDDMVMENAQA